MNNPNKRPPGVSPSMWIVKRANGDQHIVEKEPLGGILAWAAGQNVTIIQYNFATVLCEIKPPKGSPK